MYAERVWGCEGDGNDGVVAVSVACECMGGTRGSGVVSCADDVLEMSVVRGVRGVGRVCEMCLALGVVGSEWVRGLGVIFTNPVGTGGVWDMCLGCGGVGGAWVGGVVLCL